MADVGYVQLRRGILEHLQVGRLTSDEFAAFTVILLKADYRTGVWPGTSKTLARLLGWCERKGRSVLGELGAKGYLCITRVRRHRSEVTINRYFGQNSAAPGCRHSADGGTGMPSLSRIAAPRCRQEQEVILRKPPQEGAPQDPRHAGGNFPGEDSNLKPDGCEPTVPIVGYARSSRLQSAKKGASHVRRRSRSEFGEVEMQRSLEALAYFEAVDEYRARGSIGVCPRPPASMLGN